MGDGEGVGVGVGVGVGKGPETGGAPPEEPSPPHDTNANAPSATNPRDTNPMIALLPPNQL